jgi:hypothetical protein
MTREDARIIFGNISDLAEFANDFVARLEIALGSVVPNGEGEDCVGALFIETVRSRSFLHHHFTIRLTPPRFPIWCHSFRFISLIIQPPSRISVLYPKPLRLPRITPQLAPLPSSSHTRGTSHHSSSNLCNGY